LLPEVLWLRLGASLGLNDEFVSPDFVYDFLEGLPKLGLRRSIPRRRNIVSGTGGDLTSPVVGDVTLWLSRND